MVAMSGAIMPAPLAMPLMVTLGLAEFDGRGRDLRERVGGHDRRARRRSSRRARPAPPAASTPSNLVASSGSPITPVEARKISSGAAADRLGRDRRRQRGGLLAGLAGEGVGVAGIDHQRAAPASGFSLARHHSTGAEGHFEWVKTPATVVPLSTPPAARRCGPCSGCRPRRSRGDAGDRGHLGDIGRGEGRDGGGHGARIRAWDQNRSSWPGLTRPSTSSAAVNDVLKDVDARHKARA